MRNIKVNTIDSEIKRENKQEEQLKIMREKKCGNCEGKSKAILELCPIRDKD